MKRILLLLCLTLPQAGFADTLVKPNFWVSNLKEDLSPWPKLGQVSISLNGPTLTLTYYTRNADKSYRSKWGINRADCNITGGFMESERTDAYLLNFSCSDHGHASLFIDFKTGTGNFSEELIKLQTSRNTAFQDCHSL